MGRAVLVKRRDLRGLRKWSVAGFGTYLIFYLQRDRSLIIIRVLHGSRDIPRALRLSASDQP